jgi:site-specific recombinase XerD
MQLLQALNLLNETCAIRHYSLKTQKSYSHWLRRYSAFLKDPKFKLLSPEEKLEAFLTRLALSGISASSQNQAFNALLFFYRDVLNLQLGPVDSLRAHRPASLRYCPDRAEVFQLLAAVTNVGGYPTRLIVHLLYACGLRVCEPLNLRVVSASPLCRPYVHYCRHHLSTSNSALAGLALVCPPSSDLAHRHSNLRTSPDLCLGSD